MIEILKDLANPIYWVTVVPLGVLFLGTFWRYDSKQIAKQQKDGS